MSKSKAINIKQEIQEQVGGYSITPETFKARFVEAPEDTWFIDEFEFANKDNNNANTGKSSHVLRFGLNALGLKVDLDKDFAPIELANFSDSQSQASKTPSKQSGNSGSKSGTENSGSNYSKVFADMAANIAYHDLEKTVLSKAIEHLSKTGDQTVLIDIFARESSGKFEVKLDNDGNPETHTVVLYKLQDVETGKFSVIVIDPNNFKYSSHLRNLTAEMQGQFPDLHSIQTLHKDVQIYNKPQGGKTGPEADKYRDCIDVATKLAFCLNQKGLNLSWNDITSNTEINKLQKSLDTAITNSDSIRMISNNSKIDTAFPGLKIPFRIKQTSEINKVGKFYKFEEAIDIIQKRNLKYNDKYNSTAAKNTYNNVLIKNNEENDSLFKSLMQYSQEYNDMLITCLQGKIEETQKHNKELLGLFYNLDNE
jgi:hypothetical protein